MPLLPRVQGSELILLCPAQPPPAAPEEPVHWRTCAVPPALHAGVSRGRPRELQAVSRFSGAEPPPVPAPGTAAPPARPSPGTAPGPSPAQCGSQRRQDPRDPPWRLRPLPSLAVRLALGAGAAAGRGRGAAGPRGRGAMRRRLRRCPGMRECDVKARDATAGPRRRRRPGRPGQGLRRQGRRTAWHHVRLQPGRRAWRAGPVQLGGREDRQTERELPGQLADGPRGPLAEGPRPHLVRQGPGGRRGTEPGGGAGGRAAGGAGGTHGGARLQEREEAAHWPEQGGLCGGLQARRRGP